MTNEPAHIWSSSNELSMTSFKNSVPILADSTETDGPSYSSTHNKRYLDITLILKKWYLQIMGFDLLKIEINVICLENVILRGKLVSKFALRSSKNLRK